MKNIAVSQRLLEIHEGQALNALSDDIYKLFFDLNYQCIPIPNILGEKKYSDYFTTWCGLWSIDGFLLTGGDDAKRNDSRSSLESKILKYSELHQLPVLGICRGFQAMVLYLGGSLVECTGHVGKVHELNGQISSEVICFHEQTISQLPHQFYVTEKSSDGLIEGAARSDRPWIGWMWHPERLISPSNEIMNAISNLYA